MFLPESDLIFEHLYPLRKRRTTLGDGGEVVSPSYQLIKVEDSIHKIISILNERGHRALIIGGAVRDALLGIAPKDIDIEVYKISYEELEKVLSAYGKVDLVGQTFGVILFQPDGSDMTYDFSIPRKENKVGIGHKGFKVFFDKDMTVKDASSRRDFTFNALAYDPLENKIYDYFGGVKDLENKIIRHTSDAFNEDALRVLRCMQFQARFDFAIHPDTIAEMQKMVASEDFDDLPRERLFGEYNKWAIKGVRHDLIFKFMRDTGLIEKYPELKALAETPQDHIYHPEGNVEIHTAMTLHEMDKIIERENIVGEEKLLLVMSILLHDVGKPATTKEEMKKGRMTITSNGHEALGGTMSRDILAKMGFHEELITPVDNIVSNHLAGVSISMITARSGKLKAVKKLSRRLNPATIKQLMYVIEADNRGRGGVYKEPTGMSDLAELSLEADIQDKPYQPILRGRDLIDAGLKAPSPKFGEIIRASFEAQESGEFNDIEGAKKWLNENMNKFGAGGAVEVPRDKPAPKVLDADVEGRGGLVVGDSHADGGVPYVLEDSGTHIEEEGEEANIPNEIKDITKVYTFKGKNHEVIHKILQLVGLKLSNKVTSVRSGDLVICKASLWDDAVRTYTGTPIQIVSAVNESEGCNHIESGATMIENGKKVEMAKGGEITDAERNKILYGNRKARNKFELIGTGTAREVYDIGDGKIKKIAYNKRGIEQNKNEVQINDGTSSMLPKIFDHDKDYKWIIAEKARPATEEELWKYFDGFSFWDIEYHIWNEQGHGTKKHKTILNDSFVQELIELKERYNLDAGDLSNYKNYGFIGNDLKLIDYGMTEKLKKDSYVMADGGDVNSSANKTISSLDKQNNKPAITKAVEFVRDFDLENDFLIKARYEDLKWQLKKVIPKRNIDQIKDWREKIVSGYSKDFFTEIYYAQTDVIGRLPKFAERIEKEIDKNKIKDPDVLTWLKDYLSRLKEFLPIAIKFEAMKSRIGKKETSPEAKVDKQRQEAYAKIYAFMPSVNKEVLSRLVEDITKSFTPFEDEIYKRMDKRYRELIEVYAAKVDPIKEITILPDIPFYDSIFNITEQFQKSEKVLKRRRGSSSPYEIWERYTFFKGFTKKTDWESELDKALKAHIESLRVELLLTIMEKFEKITLPIKKYKLLDIRSGYKGFEGVFEFEFNNGSSFIFETQAIVAGGYNIQIEHLRYITHFKNAILYDSTRLSDPHLTKIVQHFSISDKMAAGGKTNAIKDKVRDFKIGDIVLYESPTKAYSMSRGVLLKELKNYHTISGGEGDYYEVTIGVAPVGKEFKRLTFEDETKMVRKDKVYSVGVEPDLIKFLEYKENQNKELLSSLSPVSAKEYSVQKNKIRDLTLEDWLNGMVNGGEVGGNYQFKNEYGSFTSIKIMPVDENLVRSKDFFTVEIKVRQKGGEDTRIQTKHKTFPIEKYESYIEDLKNRGAEKMAGGGETDFDEYIKEAQARQLAHELRFQKMYEQPNRPSYRVAGEYETRDAAEAISGEGEDVRETSDGKWQVIQRMSGGGEVSRVKESIEYLNRAPHARMDLYFDDESRKYPQKGKPNSLVSSTSRGTLTGKRKWEAHDIAAYDNKGKIVGVLSILTKSEADEESVGAFKIVVRDDARMKGWATKLLNKAEEDGIDMIEAVRHNNYSSRGRWMIRLWLEKKIESENKMGNGGLVLHRGYSFEGDTGKYYAPELEYAKNFGGQQKHKSIRVNDDAKVFDINDENNFNELLNKVGEIYFEADGSIFKSYGDFIKHDSGDIIAEANNSWIVEKYENEIKTLGYDLIKFQDGGHDAYIILNFDKVKLGMYNGGETKSMSIKELLKHLYKEHHDSFAIAKDLEETTPITGEMNSERVIELWEKELDDHFREEEERIFPRLISMNITLTPDVNYLIETHNKIRNHIIPQVRETKSRASVIRFASAIKEHILDEEKLFRSIMPDPYREITPDMMEKGGKTGLKNTKVVDAKGKPLVVYHGSQNPDIKFKGITYFTDDIDTAKSFADRSYMGETLLKGEIPTLYSAHLNIVNPKIFTTEDEYEEFFQDSSPEQRNKLQEKHDGLIYLPEDGGTNYYLVFDPSQIEIIKKEVLDEMSAGGAVDLKKKSSGKLLAPNGKPSNLNPVQYKSVRSENFKNWFGDWENSPATSSKVVDENGEPLILFHGSSDDFHIFELRDRKIGRRRTSLKAHYFTKSEWASRQYAGSDGFVKKYFLNIRNVATKESDKVSEYSNVDDFLFDYGITGLSKLGYDGAIDGNGDYAVFVSEQIKLADGTNITFDSSNPDIRYGAGGGIKKEDLKRPAKDYKSNRVLQARSIARHGQE